jgi:hypothetical protein
VPEEACEEARTGVLEEANKRRMGRDDARPNKPSRFRNWRRVEQGIDEDSMSDS